MRVKREVGFSLILGILAATGVWGDVIINDRGRRHEGTIVRETPTTVTIDLQGTEVTIPRDRIRAVERSARWENYLRAGDALLEQGDHAGATEEYEAALRTNPSEDEAAQIRARIAATQAAQAAQADTTRARALTTIDDLITRADTQRDAGEIDAALDSLDEAEVLDPTAEQTERILARRADTLYARAYQLNDRLDHSGALESIEDLFAIAPEHRDGLDLYNRLIEDQPLDSPTAVAEIESLLEREPGRLDLHASIGEYHSRRRDHAAALPHLLAAAESDLYFARIGGRLRRAMLDAVQGAVRTGDYDEAVTLYEDVLEKFPDEDENYLNMLIYYRQDQRLADDDLDGRARLAAQCHEAGYDTWAEEQMRRVLDQDPNHPAALSLHRIYAEEAFAAADLTAREGNFVVAQMQFQRFIEEYNYPDLIGRAEEMIAEAIRRAREQERLDRDRAETLVALGDEAFAAAEHEIDIYRQREYRETNNTFIIRGQSPRTQIVESLERAIDFYEAALGLDPSLGSLTGGGVNLKLADANDLLRIYRGSSFPARTTTRSDS